MGDAWPWKPKDWQPENSQSLKKTATKALDTAFRPRRTGPRPSEIPERVLCRAANEIKGSLVGECYRDSTETDAQIARRNRVAVEHVRAARNSHIEPLDKVTEIVQRLRADHRRHPLSVDQLRTLRHEWHAHIEVEMLNQTVRACRNRRAVLMRRKLGTD